ncbi:MAG: sigma 54-interacting transcriptional regulator [Desulfobacteraceae bacterium]|nr:sigma 54-interacting transcriptional regulator [Desulfobacteraceae bacterium]
MEETARVNKILVIDDDASTLSMLRLLLGAFGYDVLTAENGEAGLELFRRALPPIVLTDVRMPGIDGIDVLKQLKQADSDVEVIMITGHGDMDIAIRSLQHDASDFIAKPLRREALEVALKRAREKLDMKRQLRDHTRNLEAKVREATAELARSCESLKTLYEISQLVGETPSLSGITQLLRERIEALTHLRCYDFLLLNSRRSALARGHLDESAAAASEDLIESIQELERPLFLEAEEAARLLPSPPGPEIASLAMFPLARAGERPVGAALVGIGASVSGEELQLTSMLLSLAAGPIRRAVVQREEFEALRRMKGTGERFGNMVGRHEKIEQVYKLIASVADSDATVLIQGESGTGKEMVARCIHQMSGRNGGPFIPVNCAAYPQTLLESELFGHEKGAFTGAGHLKRGSFELAHGGTIFLDEIGEISQAAQVKLLRVLQFKEIQRIGSEHTIQVDVRILAATSRNLRHEIETGNFREDIFYRLNVIPIHLPPLRERMSDLPLLTDHFLRKIGERSNRKVCGIAPRAMDKLMHYPWPGNIRELENTMEHACILTRSDTVDLQDLPEYLREYTPAAERNGESLDEVERQHLIRVLSQYGGNRIRAARTLGISRSTLYRKLEQYGLLG